MLAYPLRICQYQPDVEDIMSTLDPQGTASGSGGADIVGTGTGEGPGPEVMAAASLDDSRVISSDGEDVGNISDIMLDVRSGRIAYAVLSEGGFLGMGANLHAIPWNALSLDTDAKCFRVSIDAQRIKDDPGFDKDHWPSMADTAWGTTLHQYYNREPYWSSTRSMGDVPPGVAENADISPGAHRSTDVDVVAAERPGRERHTTGHDS
jgi:sporulation protein YlmC with PRC-barrel domain